MLVRSAYAKLTLYSHILGDRHDGFHNVETLFTFLNLHNTTRMAASSETRVIFLGEFGQQVENGTGPNSVQDALALLENRGYRTSMTVEVTKNIPVAAGLAGGSADAVATLYSALELLRLPRSVFEVDHVAVALGVDAGRLYRGRSGLACRTDTETFHDVDLPPLWVVLTNPRKPLLTRTVWDQYRFSSAVPTEFRPKFDKSASVFNTLSETRNDLTETACSLMPEIASMIDLLERQEGCELARMSGSGPTCFGLFKTKSLADEATNQITREQPHLWVVRTSTRPGFDE